MDCRGTCFPDYVIEARLDEACADDGTYVPSENECTECPEGVAIYLNCADFGCENSLDQCLQINPEWLDAALRSTSFAKRADINNDGFVDGADLSILLGAWGNCQPDP